MREEREDLHKFTDEQLVFLIQHFNQDPFEVLLERYNPLIGKLIRTVAVYGMDPDDLRQEARMVFYRVVQCYEEDRGLTVGMLFKLSLQRHLYSIVRKQKAEKRKNEKQAASLERMVDSGWAHQAEFRIAEKNAPLDYLLMNDKLDGFADTLSSLERSVFQAYIEHRSLKEIAARMKCPEAKVRNALERCKRKLKNHLEE